MQKVLCEIFAAAAICACVLLGARAAEEPPATSSTLPSFGPARSGAEDTLASEVTIRHGEKQTVHEYRINGEVRAIKVVPFGGLPYYLVDADGDGSLETRHSELAPEFLIPSWVIRSW